MEFNSILRLLKVWFIIRGHSRTLKAACFNSASSHYYLYQSPLSNIALAVEFSLHRPSGEDTAVGPANPGLLASTHPLMMPPECLLSSLTILQSCDGLSLRAEVTVSDVIGCFHSQFVRGEGVQAVQCKNQKGWGVQSSQLALDKPLQRARPLATKITEQLVSSPHCF